MKIPLYETLIVIFVIMICHLILALVNLGVNYVRSQYEMDYGPILGLENYHGTQEIVVRDKTY